MFCECEHAYGSGHVGARVRACMRACMGVLVNPKSSVGGSFPHQPRLFQSVVHDVTCFLEYFTGNNWHILPDNQRPDNSRNRFPDFMPLEMGLNQFSTTPRTMQ